MCSEELVQRLDVTCEFAEAFDALAGFTSGSGVGPSRGGLEWSRTRSTGERTEEDSCRVAFALPGLNLDWSFERDGDGALEALSSDNSFSVMREGVGASGAGMGSGLTRPASSEPVTEPGTDGRSTEVISPLLFKPSDRSTLVCTQCSPGPLTNAPPPKAAATRTITRMNVTHGRGLLALAHAIARFALSNPDRRR